VAERGRREAEENIQDVIANARLDAEPHILLRRGRSIAEVMHVEAEKADLAIMGFALPEAGEPVEPFFERLSALLAELPTTLLVHSARSFASEPVLFDGE